jgi:biopolymer transport protein ExbD
VITLTRDGSLYLEERELSVSEFDAVFSAIYSKTEDRPVFIRGDAEIRYREIIQIIDRLKGHGVTKIGLATDLQMSR